MLQNLTPRKAAPLILLVLPILLLSGAGVAVTMDSRALSGGETTVFETSREAFARPAANLPTAKLRDFAFGNRLFNTQWAPAPASVTSLDGLGPLFNRNSCSGCHFKDGRGRPPGNSSEPMLSMLIRLSIAGGDSVQGVTPHPVYGDQLSNQAVHGSASEGEVKVEYVEQPGVFPDGETYSLRIPRYLFVNLNYGPMGESILISPRTAPAVFGLGLLESITEADILRREDPEDADADGISGRANRVWNKSEKTRELGRFGWKANQSTLAGQAAAAFIGDIGITSSLEQNEILPPGFENNISGGTPEISDTFFDKLIFYLRTLAVPARRNLDDPGVRKGGELFRELACVSCHVDVYVTAEHLQVPQLSHQTIHPYTDLLLHDMGEDLADGRPDFDAGPNEWRTPPLWGIGLVETVNGHTNFLHDGRARNLTEAILWHGGEASASREAFRALSASDRNALILFLESL